MFLERIHPLRYATAHLSLPEILHLGTGEFNLHNWLLFHFFLLNIKHVLLFQLNFCGFREILNMFI